MKKKMLLLVFCLLGLVNLYCEYWIQFDHSKLSKSKKQEVRKRSNENKRKVEEFNSRKGTDWKISWHSNKKFMQSANIRIDKSNITDSLSAVTFAEELLHDFLSFIGVNRKELIISNVEVEHKREWFMVKFKQHINNVFFEENGGISVGYSRGRLTIGNSCFANFHMDTIPSITKDEAWRIAKMDAGPEITKIWNKPDSTGIAKVIEQNDGSTVIIRYAEDAFGTEQSYKDKTELLFYQEVERTEEGKYVYKDFKLAYRILISHYIYYLDAINGEIIKKTSPLMQGRNLYTGHVTGDVYQTTTSLSESDLERIQCNFSDGEHVYTEDNGNYSYDSGEVTLTDVAFRMENDFWKMIDYNNGTYQYYEILWYYPSGQTAVDVQFTDVLGHQPTIHYFLNDFRNDFNAKFGFERNNQLHIYSNADPYFTGLYSNMYGVHLAGQDQILYTILAGSNAFAINHEHCHSILYEKLGRALDESFSTDKEGMDEALAVYFPCTIKGNSSFLECGNSGYVSIDLNTATGITKITAPYDDGDIWLDEEDYSHYFNKYPLAATWWQIRNNLGETDTDASIWEAFQQLNSDIVQNKWDPREFYDLLLFNDDDNEDAKDKTPNFVTINQAYIDHGYYYYPKITFVDGDGYIKENSTYEFGEDIYIQVENLPPHEGGFIYIVLDNSNWTNEYDFQDDVIVLNTTAADEEGNIDTFLLWTGGDTYSGRFDVIFDVNGNQELDFDFNGIIDGCAGLQDGQYGFRVGGSPESATDLSAEELPYRSSDSNYPGIYLPEAGIDWYKIPKDNLIHPELFQFFHIIYCIPPESRNDFRPVIEIYSGDNYGNIIESYPILDAYDNGDEFNFEDPYTAVIDLPQLIPEEIVGEYIYIKVSDEFLNDGYYNLYINKIPSISKDELEPGDIDDAEVTITGYVESNFNLTTDNIKLIEMDEYGNELFEFFFYEKNISDNFYTLNYVLLNWGVNYLRIKVEDEYKAIGINDFSLEAPIPPPDFYVGGVLYNEGSSFDEPISLVVEVRGCQIGRACDSGNKENLREDPVVNLNCEITPINGSRGRDSYEISTSSNVDAYAYSGEDQSENRIADFYLQAKKPRCEVREDDEIIEGNNNEYICETSADITLDYGEGTFSPGNLKIFFAYDTGNDWPDEYPQSGGEFQEYTSDAIHLDGSTIIQTRVYQFQGSEYTLRASDILEIDVRILPKFDKPHGWYLTSQNIHIQSTGTFFYTFVPNGDEIPTYESGVYQPYDTDGIFLEQSADICIARLVGEIYYYDSFTYHLGSNDVCGEIRENTLPYHASPYFTTGDIIISAEDTLNIEPGCKLYFYTLEDQEDPDNIIYIRSKLYVFGNLNAIGEPGNLIEFTRNGDLGWGGIECDAEPITENNFVARLEYCYLSDIGKFQYGIFTNHKNVSIINCIIDSHVNHEGKGVYVEYCDNEIEGNKFGPTIIGCEISNFNTGIYLLESEHVNISNNTITGNSKGINAIDCDNISVMNCILDNPTNLHAHVYKYWDHLVQLINCKIVGGAESLEWDDSYSQTGGGCPNNVGTYANLYADNAPFIDYYNEHYYRYDWWQERRKLKNYKPQTNTVNTGKLTKPSQLHYGATYIGLEKWWNWVWCGYKRHTYFDVDIMNNLTTYDLEGNYRLFGGQIDIGAYESNVGITTIDETIIISGNVIWGNDANEIHITGNIIIEESGLLTILPGVSVIFQEEFNKMTVHGKLIAEGFENNQITFTTTESNQSAGWGGIYFHEAEESVLNNCIIEYAKLWAYGNGGPGINIRSCVNPITIENCIIRHCYSINSGAGIYIYNSDCNILNNEIHDNVVLHLGADHARGGGIYCTSSSPIIKGNAIFNNTCQNNNEGDSFGGGIYFHQSSPTFKNNVIYSNTAVYGGGVYLNYNSDITILNSNIKDNAITCEGNGAGICISGSTADIYNSILDNNIGSAEEPNYNNVYFMEANSPDIKHCNVHGGENSLICSNGSFIGSYENNNEFDIHFDYNVETDLYPYKLHSYSELINSGNEIYYSNIAEETDILDNPRKYGDSILNGHWLCGQVDIGAFEYMNNPVPEIAILDANGEEVINLDFPDTYVEEFSSILITINNLGNDFLDDGMLVLEISLEGDPNSTRQFRIEMPEGEDNIRENGKNSSSTDFYSHTTRKDNTSRVQDRNIVSNDFDFTESSIINSLKEELFSNNRTDSDEIRIIPEPELFSLCIDVIFEPDCYGYYDDCYLKILSNDDDEPEIIIPLSGLALSSEINICAEVDNELKNLDELLEMDYFVFDPFPANNEPSTEEKEFIIQNHGNSIMDTLDIYIPFGFEIFDLGEEVIRKVTDNSIVTKSNSNKNNKQFSFTKTALSSSNNTAKKRDDKSLGDNREDWFREITTVEIPAGKQHRFKLHFRSYKCERHPIGEFEGDMIILSDDRKNNEDNEPNWPNTAYDEFMIEIELEGKGTPIVFSSAFPNIDPNQISGNILSDWRIVCPEVRVYEDIVIHPGVLLNINKCNENLNGDPEPDPVVFKFVENNSIFVEGQIIAEGDEEDFIMFKDFDNTDQYYWQGIIFDDNVSSELSEMDFCEIMEAHSSAIKSISFSNLVISNCYLHDNLSTYGAAVYCDNSDIIIQNNLITLNEATQNGGALYSLNSLIQLMNNTVENNLATNGGGIFLDVNHCRDNGAKTKKQNRKGASRGETRYITALIFANYIQKNIASQNGGGIYSNMNEVTIKSNVFEGNESINGGAIYVVTASNILLNNTIVRNNAVFGAGIYCNTDFPVIQNNIVWNNVVNGNTSIFPSDFNQNVSYNIIQDNECDQYHNLDHDPGFIGGSGNHSYSLTETSICINGGNRVFIDDDFDILGSLRITQGHGRPIVDIGAYEYIGEYIVVNQYEIDKVDYYNKRFISYSPAHITSNLLIYDYLFSQVLEISPNTTFEFDESLYIKVSPSGRLLAQGNVNEEITFTSASYASYWGGIRYDRTEITDNLEYCLFNNGKTTNGGAILIDAVINFNLTNCEFYNNEVGENGGAIHIDKSSNNINIINCTFLKNKCRKNGGAISIVNSGRIQINNSSFTENSTEGNGSSNGYGGGIYNYGSNLDVQSSSFDRNWTHSSTGLSGGAICGRDGNSGNSTNFIQNNDFLNNSANGIGGTMYFINTDLKIYGNHISYSSSKGFDPKTNQYNTIGYGGGAIAINQCNSVRNSIDQNIIENCSSEYGAAINCIFSTCIIDKNIIRENRAYKDGGGIYLLTSSCNLRWNHILYNTADNGGGLYTNSSTSSMKILNNYVFDNHALTIGGGFYSDADDVNLKFVNNTLVDNDAGEKGSAIYCTNSSINPNLCINNSILYNSSMSYIRLVDIADNENLKFSYCDIKGMDDIISTYPEIRFDRFCFDIDPEFISNNDYHIPAGSACCDSGNNDYLDELDLRVDLDGNERIINVTGSGYFVDIGADECNESVIVNNIEEDTFWNGLIRIGGCITILPNVTLTIADNTTIIFDPRCTLKANLAELVIGNYVDFISDELDEENGLYTESTDLSLIGSSFTNCNLFANGETIIENSSFQKSRVNQENYTISICNSIFESSNVYTFRIEKAYLDGNTFSNNPEVTAISLNGCEDYTITNNNIINQGTAIWLNESGLGRDRLIYNNYIYANEYGYGIEIYHSYADINGCNEITSNYIGIAGLRNSQINLETKIEEPYQLISNNYFDETVFAYDSFPITFMYNIIFDNVNQNQGLLVRCNDVPAGETLDIRWNYWNEIENLPEYLYPSSYVYEPFWELINPENIITLPDQELYELAIYNFEHEDYFLAEQLFKKVIEDYPESKYVKLAAQDLLTVTPYTSGNYEDLKIYYQEEPNLHDNLEIADFTDYLANYCRVELEDYRGAIDWFEHYIANSPSIQDSIYAVIDIGYIYLLMGETGKSHIGRYPQYKPNSKKDFFEKQQNLISFLLYNEKINYTSANPEIIISNYPDLYQNYPNPFNPETTISFSIPIDCKVNLTIYNIKGQKIKTLMNKYLEKGLHGIIWNSKDNSGKQVSSGVYFYRLKTERKQIIRKMLLLK